MLVVKNPLTNIWDVSDVGLTPGSGRSPGGWHGNPLQYSCLENPMDRGAWWATVHVVAKSRTGLIQLSLLACSPHCITNHPKTQWFKTTAIIYFSHESVIWAGPHGDDSSLLFAVSSVGSCRIHSVLPHLQGQQADSGCRWNISQGSGPVTSGSLHKSDLIFYSGFLKGRKGGQIPRVTNVEEQEAFSLSNLRSHMVLLQPPTVSQSSHKVPPIPR